jgi:hypothetical protein
MLFRMHPRSAHAPQDSRGNGNDWVYVCVRGYVSQVKSITFSIIPSSAEHYTMSSPNFTCIVRSDAALPPVGLTQLVNHPATIPCIAVGALSGVLAWHGSAILWSIIGRRARRSPIHPRDRWAHDSLTTRPNRIGPSCCAGLKCGHKCGLKCSVTGRLGPPGSAGGEQTAQPNDLGELPLWYHAWNIQQATTSKGVSWISKPWLEGLEAKVRDSSCLIDCILKVPGTLNPHGSALSLVGQMDEGSDRSRENALAASARCRGTARSRARPPALSA